MARLAVRGWKNFVKIQIKQRIEQQVKSHHAKVNFIRKGRLCFIDFQNCKNVVGKCWQDGK